MTRYANSSCQAPTETLAGSKRTHWLVVIELRVEREVDRVLDKVLEKVVERFYDSFYHFARRDRTPRYVS